jgi:hypothetical protein
MMERTTLTPERPLSLICTSSPSNNAAMKRGIFLIVALLALAGCGKSRAERIQIYEYEKQQFEAADQEFKDKARSDAKVYGYLYFDSNPSAMQAIFNYIDNHGRNGSETDLDEFIKKLPPDKQDKLRNSLKIDTTSLWRNIRDEREQKMNDARKDAEG